uniref:endo-polygalacturonase n=2 Tax=Leptinotarsa decemlineata TaxID=7539 RepID=E7CJ02_LEPDE|nr:endopolygalacturonase [Leptinotarsa decemlineata]
MSLLSVIIASLLVTLTAAKPSFTGDNCTITEFSQVESVSAKCTNIIVSNLQVPGGETLDFKFKKPGVHITFEGKTTFGYQLWKGPLIRIQGVGITVTGAPGSVLDGQGALYWEGKNGKKTKPKFFKIKVKEGSVFKDIHLLNCPVHCVSVSMSDHVTLSGWNIDVSAGDKDELGHNTDGFDISETNNILIENAIVQNQDDCVAVNQGFNMTFRNLECIGGHGLSLSVGMSHEVIKNTVANVTFRDSIVKNSRNGIHVKTHTNSGEGLIRDITYKNIEMTGIWRYGVNVEQDYKNGKSTGNATNNIPIRGLTLTNVNGQLTGPESVPVYILCGSEGCENFEWSEVSFRGASNPSSCNYEPRGFHCPK